MWGGNVHQEGAVTRTGIVMEEYFMLRCGDNPRLAEVYGPVDAFDRPFPTLERIDLSAHGTCGFAKL